MAEPWRIEGEYLENCNCEVLCPCLLGPRNARGGATARPTEGHCDVPLVFRIERGQYGRLDLGGTHAALVIHTPGPMGEGNWTIGAYLDQRPDFPGDVWADWEADKREKFEARWPTVQKILDAFEELGIYLLDVSPGNIAFLDPN